MVFGVVMYDFQAERADELEAKAGEAIIVIAQSNPEWFVAKPIGRLGGPGLIPVSFVEIRDMASNTPVPNPQEAVRLAGIPKVEEWKKMAADYKNSSITLGKFEVGGSGGGGGGGGGQMPLEQGMERMSLQQGGGGGGGGRLSQSNGYVSCHLQIRPSPIWQRSFTNRYSPPTATKPYWLQFAEDHPAERPGPAAAARILWRRFSNFTAVRTDLCTHSPLLFRRRQVLVRHRGYPGRWASVGALPVL